MENTSIIGHDVDFFEKSQRYTVTYFWDQILVRVTWNSHIVRQWLANVSRPQTFRRVVGLDVKFGCDGAVVLISLSVRRSCLIFQYPCASTIPQSMYRFFSDPNIVFVGVRLEGKLDRLKQACNLGEGAGYRDLGVLVSARYVRRDLRRAGVEELRVFLYGKDAVRPEVEGDFNEGELGEEKVHVACLDSYACYQLGCYLVFPVLRVTR